MMQFFPLLKFPEIALPLLISAPLIVLPLRAAIDPSAAIAGWNRLSSEFEALYPPWIPRSLSDGTISDTPAARAVLRVLCAMLIGSAFYHLAGQLSRALS